MSIVQAITDFFESIFRSSSPEVQKRLKLRKIENELRMHPAGIYKGELLQPNFAEALRVLYVNLQPIAQILDNTVTSGDVKRNHRFEQELIITGYSEEDKQLLDSLSYEKRMYAVMHTPDLSEHKIFENQRHALEKVVAGLNAPQFAKIDDVMASLKQLSDLCRFNFITPLQIFDEEFSARHNDENYTPNFVALPVATFESFFLDLYYLTASFSIDAAMGNAILALNALLHGKENDVRTKKELTQNLRKIRAILNNLLTANTLQNLIRLSKGDPNFVPQKASYSENVSKAFAEKLIQKFQADEIHIQNEIKDNYVKQEISELFPEGRLETLNGYNTDTMEIIDHNVPANFIWVVPMQILKTFFKLYYSEGLRGLLNDIVVEGLFTSPAKKTDFSQMVYALNDSVNLITQFEDSFSNDEKYSVNIIRNYINDSHKDADFGKKLVALIETINADAKEILQKTSSLLYALNGELSGFLQDAKRSSSEIVTNLKGIMFSSRNRETTSMLELQFPLWKNFFEIIKNYVIIKKAKKE